MPRINVIVEETITPVGDADILKNQVPELLEELTKKLEAACEAKEEKMIIPQVDPSEVNSTNFQVVGACYKTINTFQHQNEYPQMVEFVCRDTETARLYMQIYNWFIPATKAERLNDGTWD